MPAAQGVAAVSVGHAEPAGQGRHEAWPVEGWYWPAGHARQPGTTKVPGRYVPAGQGEHVPVPALATKPPAHIVAEEAVHEWSTGHCAHAVDPADGA